jgi:hypothetical protein
MSMPSRIQCSCSIESVTTAVSRRGHRNRSSVNRFSTSHKAGSIKEQELHPVTATVAEGKDRRRKRVKFHILLDQDSKAVDPSPEVDGLAMQVDLEICA